MIAREATEHSWTVNGLTLSGLVWGDPKQPPLLMLHGWLDNAASFTMLAPLLADFYVVALDLTGHGQSDRRSADANYQIWDDLPEILGIVEQLGWTEFDLVGHSRGAIISALLASAFPARIKHLVLLDAISPPAELQQDFPDQLRKFLEQKPALLIAQSRVFSTISEAAALRENSELSAEAALTLVERSIKPCTGGFTWTMDRRLYGASAVKLTAGQNEAVLASLTMPTLLLLAEGGRMASASQVIETLKYNATLVVEYRSGGHHFHMEDPVSPLAKRIDNFLKRGG
jgi:pimeloyl-ACP methyl ester carboxylesterase